MTVMFVTDIPALTCEQYRSITTHKTTGETLTVPIQVKCLGEAIGYDAVVDNVTGAVSLILVCKDHAGDLNES